MQRFKVHKKQTKCLHCVTYLNISKKMKSLQCTIVTNEKGTEQKPFN